MKKICFLLFFVLCFFSASAQLQNTFQFGYGKPVGDLSFPSSHHFFMAYQRDLNKRLFLSLRGSYAARESNNRFFDGTNDIFLEYGTGNYRLRNLQSTDDPEPGLYRLSPKDEYSLTFKLTPNIGYNFFAPERTFQLCIYGGGAVYFEKLKLLGSGIAPFVEITDDRIQEENPYFLFEAYTRGIDFAVQFGFQVSFALPQDLLIGFDADIQTQFGGQGLTHNLFIGKKF